MSQTYNIREASLRYRIIKKVKDRPLLDHPEAAIEYAISAFANPLKEQVVVIFKDTKGYPIAWHLLSIGSLTSSTLSVRDIFKPALLMPCLSFILLHNHPSGDPLPSTSDVNLTRQIKDASTLLDIRFDDHIILGDPASKPRVFYSFLNSGFL